MKHFYSGASSQFNELKILYCAFFRWNFLSTLPSKVRSFFFRGSILGDGNPKGPSSLCPSIAIVITQRAGYSTFNGYDDVLGIFSGSNPTTEKNHDIPPRRKSIVRNPLPKCTCSFFGSVSLGQPCSWTWHLQIAAVNLCQFHLYYIDFFHLKATAATTATTTTRRTKPPPFF